ncbi:MAG TPA: ABC transporter substrate-binding protein [Actinomycetota bacterium]
MDGLQRRFDEVRADRTELENHLIDELAAGRLTRRDFVRRGTVLGMSAAVLSFVAAACGKSTTNTNTGGSTGSVKKGGAMTVGIIAPSGAINPLTVADEGGLAVLGQAGEYLTWSDKDLKLSGVLAESWSPNADASVWTFKLRQNVTFNDGTSMKAADVVKTFQAHSDPNGKSNALSAFSGVLSPHGVQAVDDHTVAFHLDAPNGNFPYLVSSDNYNTIVLPASYDYAGKYEQKFAGTGPWKMTSFKTGSEVAYEKNPSYWQASAGFPVLNNLTLKFYDTEQPRILALQSKSLDVVSQFSASTGQQLLSNPSIKVLALRSSAHRQVHMRTDKEPFTDKLVRQAIALLIDRPGLVNGLFNGKAEAGNDSPFAAVFPSTDTSVPQRTQNVDQAKQLLAAAGKSGGFTVTLATWNGYEIPLLAQAIKAAVKQVGGTINLSITPPGTYYGDAVFGKSPWLDSTMGITDYGHRGVPNVFLGAPLTSKGTWNSAHFHNAQYDGLVKQYVAAVDLSSQRAVAKQIETLLLDETPIIFPYFYSHLTATQSNIANVEPTAMGHIRMLQAGFTS